MTQARIRSRQKLGKYRVEKRLASGGFADVYRAYDTIEGVRVALKIPQPELVNHELLEDFKKEVRLHARLDHPNILPVKNADWIDGWFVIACQLGDGTLGERLTRRISLERALDYADQILAGLAHAHAHRVLHCDLKPDNFLLFGDHVRLTDFGLAKVAQRSMLASGSGTIGYMAPEQAMGRPSLRSDVFAAGLVIYRMLSGRLPEWPFEWPLPGIERLEKRAHPLLISFLERSLRVNPAGRFEDAQHMHDTFQGVHSRALRFQNTRRKKRNGTDKNPDWLGLRIKHFNRTFRKPLEAHASCTRCEGPVSEAMIACPWCGTSRKTHKGETRYPARCGRCKRGVKLDWKFCGWCYGAKIGPESTRTYTDKRYQALCSNRACERRELLPFMRYCPWCRTKVRRAWRIEDSADTCPGCKQGVLGDHWSTCPWCARKLSMDPARSKVKS